MSSEGGLGGASKPTGPAVLLPIIMGRVPLQVVVLSRKNALAYHQQSDQDHQHQTQCSTRPQPSRCGCRVTRER